MLGPCCAALRRGSSQSLGCPEIDFAPTGATWAKGPSRRHHYVSANFLFLGPVTDVGFKHAILEALFLKHRLRHIVERDNAHQRRTVHHRQITHMVVDHASAAVPSGATG